MIEVNRRQKCKFNSSSDENPFFEDVEVIKLLLIYLIPLTKMVWRLWMNDHYYLLKWYPVCSDEIRPNNKFRRFEVLKNSWVRKSPVLCVPLCSLVACPSLSLLTLESVCKKTFHGPRWVTHGRERERVGELENVQVSATHTEPTTIHAYPHCVHTSERCIWEGFARPSQTPASHTGHGSDFRGVEWAGKSGKTEKRRHAVTNLPPPPTHTHTNAQNCSCSLNRDDDDEDEDDGA